MSAVRIRAIDLGCAAEMAAVVRGMAATLDEVVGVDRGVARYDADWLEDRGDPASGSPGHRGSPGPRR